MSNALSFSNFILIAGDGEKPESLNIEQPVSRSVKFIYKVSDLEFDLPRVSLF